MSTLAATALAEITGLLTSFEKLDLGEKYGEVGCYTPPKPQDKYYPSVYISSKGDGKDFTKIPRKGKATVEYRVRERTVREDEEGEKRHNLTLEIRSFEPTEEAKPADKAAAVKAEMLQAMDQLTQLAAPLGERGRDGAGRFVGNETGGADPQTMKQAYGEPKKKSGLLGPGLAAAALAGGAIAGVRKIRRNWGGPGVPMMDSLKAAGSHAKSSLRKAWAERQVV
ncbi:hypothetical protein [Verrucomicrobium sp. BvORR034]|uniref:hypothetical protein n=1 Tax=Verrucomicrobium sp. BvORR034 TaxID=1396418 RepID=UPI0006786705|nr:hypothetical protein [Verrucomicrobium sp. BvORR034]